MHIFRFPVSEKSEQEAETKEGFALGQTLFLSADSSHHLKKVARARLGEPVELYSAKQNLILNCLVTDLASPLVVATITEISPRLLTPHVRLVLGACKPATIDQIIESCVEVGVHEISIFRAERSNAFLDKDQNSKRQERWERIRQAALQQSGFHGLPQITIYPDLNSTLSAIHSGAEGRGTKPIPGELRALLSIAAKERISLPDYINQAVSPSEAQQDSRNNQLLTALQHSSINAECSLVVGPEGGLTQGEEELAQDFGYQAVSLGVKTMRAETAAVVSVALSSLLRQ